MRGIITRQETAYSHKREFKRYIYIFGACEMTVMWADSVIGITPTYTSETELVLERVLHFHKVLSTTLLMIFNQIIQLESKPSPMRRTWHSVTYPLETSDYRTLHILYNDFKILETTLDPERREWPLFLIHKTSRMHSGGAEITLCKSCLGLLSWGLLDGYRESSLKLNSSG